MAIPFRGANILCGPGNKLEERLLTDPESYDRVNFAVLCSIVGPGAVCLDIGANIGIYTAVMSVAVGATGQVHAFEPVPHVRRKLAANVALNGGHNVINNPTALGAEPATLQMRQVREGEFRAGTSTFVENNNVRLMGEERFEKVDVEVRTLDDYASGFERLDFIKIDVEGFELPVLKGGMETIRRLRPAILFEHDQPRLAELGVADADFEALFSTLGYSAFEIAIRNDALWLAPFEWDRKIKGNNLLALHLGD